MKSTVPTRVLVCKRCEYPSSVRISDAIIVDAEQLRDMPSCHSHAKTLPSSIYTDRWLVCHLIPALDLLLFQSSQLPFLSPSRPSCAIFIASLFLSQTTLAHHHPFLLLSQLIQTLTSASLTLQTPPSESSPSHPLSKRAMRLKHDFFNRIPPYRILGLYRSPEMTRLSAICLQ